MIITISDAIDDRLEIHLLKDVLPQVIPDIFRTTGEFEESYPSQILSITVNFYYLDEVAIVKIDGDGADTEITRYHLVDYVMGGKYNTNKIDRQLAKMLRDQRFTYINSVDRSFHNEIFIRLLDDGTLYEISSELYQAVDYDKNNVVDIGQSKQGLISLGIDNKLSNERFEYDDVIKFAISKASRFDPVIFLNSEYELLEYTKIIPKIREQGRVENFSYDDLSEGLLVLFNDGSLDYHQLDAYHINRPNIHQQLFGPGEYRIRFASTTSLDKEINSKMIGTKTKNPNK